MKEIKVIQIGMGPLGLKIADFIAKRNGIQTVAAIDKNPELTGQSLHSLIDDFPHKIMIENELKEAVDRTQPDVAIITTVSDMQRISAQIEEVVELGLPVVSTCEELSYPWINAPDLSRRLDKHAKAKNVSVIGTGVNPGFLMDALPTFLTSVCQDVQMIKIDRYQDATYRRKPFQEKIGAGLTLEMFEERKKRGTLRHVGLTESIQFIASHLGWTLDKSEDIIHPVMVEKDMQHAGATLKKGMVRGVRQIGNGYVHGEKKIQLIFHAAVGEPESFDNIEIIGEPAISSRIAGGVNGDIATCAITVNACRSILKAQPGLRTMSDLPMPSYFS
ncbi:MAG: hypothetical protein R3345_07655, partial [Fulvivirga sp.]|nr:hypothetical protein [Fulvivirga sp.]